MNCLEAQKRITAFLHGSLPDKELGEFIEHVGSCAECREELDIYLTLEKALNDEDTEDSVPFGDEKQETEAMLKNASRKLWMTHVMKIGTRCFYIFLVIVAVLILLIQTGRLPEIDQWGNALSQLLFPAEKVLVETESELLRETENEMDPDGENDNKTKVPGEKESDGKR